MNDNYKGFLLALLMVSATAHGATTAEGDADTGSTPPGEEEAPWLDTGHAYVVQRADNIARWMDNFFGVNRVEEEAPYSTLRLRLEHEWDEIDDHESDIKLRGKVYLPKLNKRLSLLFSDDDDGIETNDLIDKQDSPDDVALQYTAREKERYRIDFKLGLRSSLHPKASVRYRYEYPMTESLIGRFSEEVLYRGDDGFGSRTRLELDKILSDDKVLQWYNRVDWEEEESGLQWRTGLSLNRRLSDKRALGYFIGASGETSPYHLTESYGFGMRYRQNIYRPWLFIEVQPRYAWRKSYENPDREGAANILLRLEAVFTRDFGD